MDIGRDVDTLIQIGGDVNGPIKVEMPKRTQKGLFVVCAGILLVLSGLFVVRSSMSDPSRAVVRLLIPLAVGALVFMLPGFVSRLVNPEFRMNASMVALVLTGFALPPPTLQASAGKEGQGPVRTPTPGAAPAGGVAPGPAQKVEVSVKAPVMGPLEIRAGVGTVVEKGQLLAIIADPDLEAQVAAAEVGADSAVATVESLDQTQDRKSQVAEKELALARAARARAEKRRDRAKELHGSVPQAASKEFLDEAEAALVEAAVNVEMIESRNALSSQVRDLELRHARREREARRAWLGRLKQRAMEARVLVRAPEAGVVVAGVADGQERVRPGEELFRVKTR